MTLAYQALAYGVAPAVIAMVLWYAAARLFPSSMNSRYASALGFGVAFFTGYALLPDWAALQPERHWQWLPHLTLAAMLLGPVSIASGLHRLERYLVYGLLFLLASWMLVPTWADLQPTRPTYIGLLAAYLFVIAALLEPLPKRVAGPVFIAALAGTAAASSLLLALAISIKFAQIAGIAAAALTGCFAISLLRKAPADLRSLAPLYSLAVGGIGFAGYLEPTDPLWPLLLVPLAPLALWLAAAGPLAHRAPRTRILLQLGAVVLWLLIAGLLLEFLPGSGASDSY